MKRMDIKVMSFLTYLDRKESGFGTLVAVLILLILGALVIAPILLYMGTGLEAGRTHERRTQELYAADSGVNYGMWHLQWGEATVPEGGFLEYQFTLNDKTVDVTIEEPETDTYRITSTATTDEDSSTTVEAFVAWVPTEGSGDWGWIDMSPDDFEPDETYNEFELLPGQTHNSNVYSQQNVKLGVGASIGSDGNSGKVYTGGNIILDADATIYGDVHAEGNVQLAEGAEILGNVYSFEDTQTEIYGYIQGHVIAVQGNVQLKPGGEIGGSVCSGQNIQLDIGAEIGGGAYAAQNVDLYEDAIVAGDVYVGQTFSAHPTAHPQEYQDYADLNYECPLSESGNTEYEFAVLSYTIK